MASIYRHCLLFEHIFTEDMAVDVTVLVDSFLAKHIIVQEAGKAGNWDIFCGMAGYENTSTLYNNDPQLDTREESVRKPFR